MSKRTVLIALGILAIVGFISLRHYFSPGEVAKRKFIATIEAFEEERLLAVMSRISRGYSDPWGLNYEAIAGYLNEAMETYEDLDVDSLFSNPVVVENGVRIEIQFVVWGRYEGTKGYVIGSITEPCTATVLWREENTGWRLASIEELDIPELRSQLESMKRD